MIHDVSTIFMHLFLIVSYVDKVYCLDGSYLRSFHLCFLSLLFWWKLLEMFLFVFFKEKLFVKKKFIIICIMLRNIFFHKNIVGENSPPSQFLKEKCGSAKSDVSKVLFPDIGKITNLSWLWFILCLEIMQRGGSILLIWENETSCTVFLKQCFKTLSLFVF